MKPFKPTNESSGRKAIRRGVRVPEGDVNVAWVRAPTLNPEDNMIIIDTSNLTPENSGERSQQCRVFAANQYGILEDIETGDDVVKEEYPVIGDTFSVDEDFSVLPGSEYTSGSVLTYVHVSRFFHVDAPGLSAPNMFVTVDGVNSDIKIVDENGKDYLNPDGSRKYRIVLTEVPNVSTNYSGSQTAYRVYAYLGSDTNEGLYLKYNKVELDEDLLVRNQDINHKEITNPQPYYDWVPEEAEVQDYANRNRRIFTTKPVMAKEKILGKDISGKDGYRMYAPKKAIPDPRRFQLFRWRVACDVEESLNVDQARSQNVIRAGIITTNTMPENYDLYIFYNLELSDYNAGGLKFINPLRESLGSTDDTLDRENRKNTKAYWNVNLDTVTYEELKQFDILVWNPGPRASVDVSRYLAKIRYFTETVGGTFIYETLTGSNIQGAGVTITAPTNAVSGDAIGPGTPGWAYATEIFVSEATKEHPVFSGTGIGGWNMNDGTGDEYRTLHPGKLGIMTYWALGDGKTNYISDTDSTEWTSLVEVRKNNAVYSKLILKDIDDGGLVFYSTGMLGLSGLEDPVSGQRVVWNRGDTAYDGVDLDGYKELVSSWTVEGAYKMFYNICLMSIKNRIIDDTDEERMSSSWSLYSPWLASWVIRGDLLTEGEKNKYDFLLQSKSLDDPEMVWSRLLDPYKTVKQLFEDSQTPEDLRKIAGMTRSYRLEVTNPQINTVSADDINDRAGKVRPYAWTEAYSPPFTVPPELGPHIVEEEPMMAGYQPIQYLHRTYPNKSYGMYCSAVGTVTSQQTTAYTVNWTVTGTADLVRFKTNKNVLTWAEHGGNEWYTHPDNGLIGAAGMGVTDPKGIDVVSYANYYEWALPVYANFGIHKRLFIGSYGEETMFVQQALNYFHQEGWVSLPEPLVLDGVYGPKTAYSILTFQIEMGCYIQDGNVDAETWSAIGMQVVRLDRKWLQDYGFQILKQPPGTGPWHRWFTEVRRKMSRTHISDGNNNSVYMEQSPTLFSPAYVFDLFQVSVASQQRIVAVDVIPYTEGLTNTVRLEAIDVHDRNVEGQDHTPFQGGMIGHYNISKMRVPLRRRIKDGDTAHIPVGPWRGDTVTVAIGQDGPSGFGDSRILGIRDIRIHTAELGLTSSEITVTASGTAVIKTGQDVVIDLKPDYTGEGALRNIQWNTIVVTPSAASTELHKEISSDGTKLILRNLDVHNNSDDIARYGPPLIEPSKATDSLFNPEAHPATPYYSMNEFGRLNPGREFGWISKIDGIKLFCDQNKRPWGFPEIPEPVSGYRWNELQNHYTLMTLNAIDCDPSVLIGFYDIQDREFIVDTAGRPRMTYIEYLKRGPENVFIAAISSFEEDVVREIGSEGASPLPFKWAKPVYGVCFKSGSQIGIEKPPSGLGPFDLWPIAIRTGKFSRQMTLSSNLDIPLTGWYKDYAGKTVNAFYSVPEAESAGWSAIHGRPYIDVVDETPILVTDNKIQVRQPPILMVQAPTSIPNLSDPLLPEITIKTKSDTFEAWQDVLWSDIKDVNASTGEVTLKNPVAFSNPDFIKVSYTTAKGHYSFKRSEDQIIDLNPYPGHRRDLIGKPIYVYLLPHYVEAPDGSVIADSVQTSTLRIALDNDVFDQFSPTYNPFAVQLGIVFISTALDINDLTIIDTRRRGGGARDTAIMDDLQRVLQESSYYWDINPGVGKAYQQGGFVLIRLPEGLKTQFPNKEEIMKVIERNITIGVAYKIENMDGEEWV